MINKRGASEVVAVILVIMISISLVAIIFVFVTGYVKPLQFSPEKCVDYQSRPPVSVREVCYDEISDDLVLSLSREVRGQNIGVVGLSIKYFGFSESWFCGDGCGFCEVLDEGDTMRYFVKTSGLGIPDSVSVSIDNCVLSGAFNVKAC